MTRLQNEDHADGRETDTKKPRMDVEDKEEGPSQPRHRVTTKGTNVPEPVESFEELHNKYDVPPRILQNLKDYGYTSPTAIQRYAAPIILEVRDELVAHPQHLTSL